MLQAGKPCELQPVAFLYVRSCYQAYYMQMSASLHTKQAQGT